MASMAWLIFPTAHIRGLFGNKRAAKCACGLTPGMHCTQNDAISSEIIVVCCFLCLFKMFKTIERPADCEIRSVIRFLTARNVSAADIHPQINEVYGHSTTAADFYDTGIQKLVDRYDKCLNKHGNYVEK
ncbi:hypothetical protein J6590_022510 [Homalodisca vitripennis]|nr:hypothetical protein J6590_022510 [Homalodisca vitripennis]